MRTRTSLVIATAVGVAGAVYAQNLAAGYITVIGAMIVYLLHTIEFKLNKLLDYCSISVSDWEISRD